MVATDTSVVFCNAEHSLTVHDYFWRRTKDVIREEPGFFLGNFPLLSSRDNFEQASNQNDSIWHDVELQWKFKMGQEFMLFPQLRLVVNLLNNSCCELSW